MQESQQAVGDVASLERALVAAGFDGATVIEESVDVGLSAPEDVVRYRLGLPHLHHFAATLTDEVRAAFLADAVAAVRRTGERFAPVVIEAVAVA